jgi:hypothetical protein
MVDPQEKKQAFLIAALVTGGALFLFGGFLGLYFTAEDFAFIYLYHRMPFLELFTEPNLKAVVVDLYRPVTDLIIYLETKLFGATAWPWHLANLLLHLTNVYLLFRVARPIAGRGGAYAAALLFAWHPVMPGLFSFNVGGIQTGGLLLFSLLCMDRLARYRIEGRRRSLWLSALFMLLAIGSYEWFPLVFTVLVYDLALPRAEGSPGKVIRLAHHAPLWLAVIVLLLARKAVLGMFIGGYPLPPWREVLPQIPGAFLASMEEFGFNPAIRGLVSDPVRIFGRWLAAALIGIPFLFWLVRLRLKFLKPVILTVLMLLFAAIPVAIVTSHDPASARRFVLPLAFLCILMGQALTGGIHAALRRPWSRALPFAGALVLAVYYGCITHAVSPYYLRAGRLTLDIRDQVLELAGPDHPKDKPIFLVDTPMTVAVNLPGQAKKRAVAKVYQFGLSMAFSPPFCDADLRVFPLNRDPALQDRLYVPFMLYMWGDGTILRFDEKADRVRKIDFAPDQADWLIEYMRMCCDGKERPALMKVRTPTRGLHQWMGPGKGFPVMFPFKLAAMYRIVLLNQHYPCKVEYFSPANRDMGRRITKEMLIPKGQGKGRYINIHFNEKILRDALVYFDNEPVFLWVEVLDERGEVFHRSELIQFRLRAYREEVPR